MSHKHQLLLLQSIKLTQFKNYSATQLQFGERTILFTGNNGAGKTNLLDAIYMLSLGKSRYIPRDSKLIIHGEDFFRIEGKYQHLSATDLVVIKYPKGGKKEILLNAKKRERISDHVGAIPLVMIGPRDIQLFFEGSADRRKFIDAGICQYDKAYLHHLITYNRLLLQRNSYLKSIKSTGLNEALLSSYDQQLLEPAEFIKKVREQFIQDFSLLFMEAYKSISGDREAVSCDYRSQLLTYDFATALIEARQKDMILQRTTVGIHKDDIIFKMNGQVLKQFGSEGQMKSFLISLKLAMKEKIKAETGKTPILLIDDIFAKLDADRVRNLLTYIHHYDDTQIFITDTDADRVSSILKDSSITHEVYYIDENSPRLIHENNSNR